ncbi:hypothetical protein ACTXIX_14785 [Glutamicibacter ardleyensis]|uniref:hypothetical protein n=1 Tax=Glutamicibacter ardleyensis TaxID=225894 RepID=UPI003FD632A8
MSVPSVAPRRAHATTSASETSVDHGGLLTKPKWCTRPQDGRVAAIMAHAAKGHKPFVKADTPDRFTTKGKTQFNASKEALASKHSDTAAPKRIRRVSRSQETSETNVQWAIPAGSRKVDHTAQAWRAARSLDELLAKRADRKRNTLAVLWVLIHHTDVKTMTIRITWDFIAEKAGISRSSVGNMLYDLRTWGILGIVASGRSAECAAMAYANRKEEPARFNDDVYGPKPEFKGEAPVYVLCRPVGLGLRTKDAPDTTATRPTQQTPKRVACGYNLEPLSVGGLTTLVESSYTRAREENTQNEPLRGTENLIRHGYAARTHQSDQRPVEQWPAHRTISSRRQGLSASAEISRIFPDFRRFSKKNILSMMKPFFTAGWTIADIQHALEWRTTPGLHGKESWGALPQQNLETQSYIDYCRILRAAILHRLSLWRTATGEIMASKSQRAKAASNHAKAAARAADERRTQQAAQRPMLRASATRGAALCRTKINESRQSNPYSA